MVHDVCLKRHHHTVAVIFAVLFDWAITTTSVLCYSCQSRCIASHMPAQFMLTLNVWHVLRMLIVLLCPCAHVSLFDVRSYTLLV